MESDAGIFDAGTRDEAYRYLDFGGYAEEEQTFEDYTIPTRLRAGWYFGSERFEPEGEFFRVQLDAATYR